MTTVSILPVETDTGIAGFEAISGDRIASGETAGEALDALTAQLPHLGDESLILVQRFRADRFFSADQQRRLQELMQRWRKGRDGGAPLDSAEQAELQQLIEAELIASGRRAESAAAKVGM
jgi:hypothetical protein